MNRSDELNEARELLEALEGRRLRNAGDQRFVESWRVYLNRVGDEARIGRWRMAVLRRVAAAYGIGRADEGET
jgi:hypothetical protein